MIDHLELQTRKVEETANFYTDVLRPLGYRLMLDGTVKGLGSGDTMDLFLVEGDPSSNVHFALSPPVERLLTRPGTPARPRGT